MTIREVKLNLGGEELNIVGDMTDEEVRVIEKRQAFAEQYCAEKGWPLDMKQISWVQILEIRDQPGWKDP
jgi:hypothetical protein